ncbi:MAG TPA: glycosyltransferase family 2 protein [Caulobacteraceae bacterium]|nr:glycosyltransferase family 2 protein [Caulobacteraceae bacterium]
MTPRSAPGPFSPPAISCIVPLYEDAALARRCLGSILAQTLSSIEVVVVDDSPTDGLKTSVADLLADPRVRYLTGPRTGNAPDNWNLGLSLAQGNWSVVVHHDEALEDPGFLERAARRLESAPGRALLTGTAAPRPGRRFALASRLAALIRAPAWTLYLANWAGPTAALVFPTTAGVRFDPRLAWTVDVDFYARLWLRTGPFLRDDATAVVSIAHPRQITARLDPIAAHRRELALLSRAGDGRLAAWQIAVVRVALGLKRLTRGSRRRAAG